MDCPEPSHARDTFGDTQGRRDFLTTTSRLVMAGGLCAGYGTFFLLAGHYVFPSPAEEEWTFVSDVGGIRPGESLEFQSPSGVDIAITRGEHSDPRSPRAEDFLALSSICPHLGCRVHWEPQNNRYFCPCHNGVFDPQGNAVSGPPAEEGKNLPHYVLQIVDQALYIRIPDTGLSVPRGAAGQGRWPARNHSAQGPASKRGR